MHIIFYINKYNLKDNAFSDFIDREYIIIIKVHEYYNNFVVNLDVKTVKRVIEKLGVELKPVSVTHLGKPSNKSHRLNVLLNAATNFNFRNITPI